GQLPLTPSPQFVALIGAFPGRAHDGLLCSMMASPATGNGTSAAEAGTSTVVLQAAGTDQDSARIRVGSKSTSPGGAPFRQETRQRGVVSGRRSVLSDQQVLASAPAERRSS